MTLTTLLNRKKLPLLLLILMVAASLIAAPKSRNRSNRRLPLDSAQLARYNDSILMEEYLHEIEWRVDSIFDSTEKAQEFVVDTITGDTLYITYDTIPINKIFLPPVFSTRPLTRDIRPKPIVMGSDDYTLELPVTIADKSIGFQRLVNRDSIENRIIYDYCMDNIEKVKMSESLFKYDSKDLDPVVIEQNISSIFRPEPIVFNKIQVENKPGVKVKLKHWTASSNLSLDVRNNYFSDNWYQGGENSTNLTSNFDLTVNYTDYKNFNFTNELYMRTGFYSTPKDTINKFRVTDDQFRNLTRVRYKAFGKINYNTSVEFKTKFYDAYPANTKDKAKRTSAFLSPAELYAGIGLSYNDKFPKLRIEYLNVSFDPLSYSFKFRKDVTIPVSGIKDGEKSIETFGNTFRADMKWYWARNISFWTRIFYFTNYEKVEAEWENRIEFSFNRYFGTDLYFMFRYDDARQLKDDKDRFLQFKENVGLKFRYRFL